MAIKVDVSALEQSLYIFKKLREIPKVPIEALGEYLNTPGVLFLRKHLLHYGGTVFDEALITQLLTAVIRAPVPSIEDNIFLRSMKHGFQYVDIMEREFNDIDISAIIQKAVMLANKYLPEKIEEEVKVYFLYGIRGMGIMLGNEIAIDICDEYVSKNGIMDISNLVAILAHEFHHVDVNKHIFGILQSMGDAKNKLLVGFLEELLSEGVAYYYLPSPYHVGGALDQIWSNNLKNISVILNKVSNYIGRICSGEVTELTESQYLFAEGLEGYTAGYIMIKAIDDMFGENAVMDCIENCLLFPQVYNLAVKKGNLGLPIMNYNRC